MITHNKELFPTSLPGSKWAQFEAEGYSMPVCGVIYRMHQPTTNGMPIGTLDTGYIDLETSGLWGFSTLFNTHIPRLGPINLPFLGLSVDKQTWVLCDPSQIKKYDILNTFGVPWELPAGFPKVGGPLKLEGVKTAKEIHYWGHYPIADLEFETDAPIGVGLRVWTSFLPGDIENSLVPGAVFEVHIRNLEDALQSGTIVFSFPGPNPAEAGSQHSLREEVHGEFNGVAIKAPQASYALGVIGPAKIRIGGALGSDGNAWSHIAETLPDSFKVNLEAIRAPEIREGSFGASVAVDFQLAGNEEKILRYVLAWYSPEWKGMGNPWVDAENINGMSDEDKAYKDTHHLQSSNTYRHMYSRYYLSETHAAFKLAIEHASLLKRILAWQEVIYTDPDLSPWLQDVLVNSFHQITELGFWAQARPPIGDWCRQEDGLFGMLESRACPQIECGPSSYYGGAPIEFFFPQLLTSTLRTHKAYQYPDGCPTWIFGGTTGRTGPCELTKPTRGYQTGQNGSWYVGMAARHWSRTGDDDFLREFYPSLKKATRFTFNLNPNRPYGLICLPGYDLQESYESTPFKGMTAHIASVRIYHLKMMGKIAAYIGDIDFATECRDWLAQVDQLLEEHLWTGTYYRQQEDPVTGDQSDVIMGYQLDGEGMALFDGIAEGAFPRDRVLATLNTLKEKCIDRWGPRVWSDPEGGPVNPSIFDPGYWSTCGVHPAGSLMLAATFIYHGDRDFGLDIARRVMENIICRLRRTWDMPNLFRGDTGDGIYGNDYAQIMMDWLLPAALAGLDISTYAAAPNKLVKRIFQAVQSIGSGG
jgi:uncharacterized protein (DUF608 family)